MISATVLATKSTGIQRVHTFYLLWPICPVLYKNFLCGTVGVGLKLEMVGWEGYLDVFGHGVEGKPSPQVVYIYWKREYALPFIEVRTCASTYRNTWISHLRSHLQHGQTPMVLVQSNPRKRPLV